MPLVLPSPSAGSGWFDAGWWVAAVAIAYAAWQEPKPRAAARDDSLRLIAAPLAAGAVAIELLVYGSTGKLNALAVALAAATLVAVMIRLTLTFRQNVAMLRASRGEALTDSLTGLANRRALTRALEALDDDTPLVLARFDLDGFKTDNDPTAIRPATCSAATTSRSARASSRSPTRSTR